MTIESTMTKKDYVKLNIALTYKSVGFWVFSAFLFLFLLLTVISTDYVGIIVWFLLVIFLLGYHWFAINRRVKSKENRNWFLPRRFEFNEDGVLVTTPFAKEELDWSTFVKWRFLAGQYVIYASGITFYAIKDEDVKDKEELVSMLNRKVKKP